MQNIPKQILDILIDLANNRTRRMSLLSGFELYRQHNSWQSPAYEREINEKIKDLGWTFLSREYRTNFGPINILKSPDNKVFEVLTQKEMIKDEHGNYVFIEKDLNDADIEPILFESSIDKWNKMQQLLQVWADVAEEEGFIPLATLLQWLSKKSYNSFYLLSLIKGLKTKRKIK